MSVTKSDKLNLAQCFRNEIEIGPMKVVAYASATSS